MSNNSLQTSFLSRKYTINSNNLLILFFLVITFISGLGMTHGDSTLSDNTVRSILASIRLVCLSISAFLLLFNKVEKNVLILLPPIIYFLIINLNSFGSADWSVISLLYLLAFLLMDATTKKKLFQCYKVCLLVMACIGIIVYLMYMVSFPFPYRVVNYYSEYFQGSYIDYGLSYIFVYSGSVRLCGLFNEPGYFGTILALILCVERLNLKKKSTWIFLIAGLLTFSLAFFLLLAIYLVFLSRNRPVLMVLLIIAIIVYLFILPNITFENPEVQRFINRFMIENGSLAGDNRSNIHVDNTLSKVLNSSDAFWGYGGGYTSAADFGSISTYKSYVIDYGVIGFVLMYGSLLIAALIKAGKNGDALAFVTCFFINVYQRPNIFAIVYFVVLFGGIEYIKQTSPVPPIPQKKGEAVI